MASTTTRYTIEEFERLPDEMVHYRELVDGELVDVSGNTGKHNRLRDIFAFLTRPFVEPRIGLIFTEQEYDFGGNAHGPDISIFVKEKIALYDADRRVQPFVPDLAIEIVSANDRYGDLIKKAARYRKCGTSEVWILDADNRKAQVHSEARNTMLSESDLFESSLIPGFSIRLGELFDRAR